jgi:hypothetical protein
MINCLLSIAILVLSLSAYGKSRTPVALKATQLRFEYASQDGDILYKCSHRFLENIMDFEVTCASGEASAKALQFIAHARLFLHERPVSPKLSYEFLYWVTDRQISGGQPGQFLGSTIWFNLQDHTPLVSMVAGQDVQNTFVLRMYVDFESR